MPERRWYYLSFVDTDLSPPPEEQVPGGPSWLGACYVQGIDAIDAVRRAHHLGCNPGGEVAIWGPFDQDPPEDQRNRLLSREDVT